MTNINRVLLTGNLTRDPELRATAGGGSVCKLGLAVNTRRKNGQTGEWEERPNFFRVTVFGRQAESCGEYLSKGRPIAVDGRLQWSQYEVEGQKRESIEIVADTIQFLGSRDDAGNGSGASRSAASAPSGTGDFDTPVATPAPVSDDDIPF
jgi:single-strand DNA-binding protein